MGNWIKCKGKGFMVESNLKVWEIGSKVKIMGKWLNSKGKWFIVESSLKVWEILSCLKVMDICLKVRESG